MKAKWVADQRSASSCCAREFQYCTHPVRDEDLPGAKPEIGQKPLILQQYTAAYNLLNTIRQLARSTESLRIQRIISPAQVSNEAKQTDNATNRVIPSH